MSRICLCIAVYDNPKSIVSVIEASLTQTSFPLIVVDDGSEQAVLELVKSSVIIQSALSESVCRILRHETNQGKGTALMTGFREARSLGFNFVLTLDGDGQHYPAECHPMLAGAVHTQEEIIIGARVAGMESSPVISRLGRNLSDFWIWCATGQKVFDSQSGMRLYPLDPIIEFLPIGKRFEFEMEVLLYLLWNGVKCRSVPVRVFYSLPGQRVSHFHKVFDNFRIVLMNLRLIFF